MSKLNAKENNLIIAITNAINTLFNRIVVKKNNSNKPIIDSSCYGTNDEFENIKNNAPVEGQIFFVLASSIPDDTTE